MNRNELFQGFEEIDESLLRRSEKSEPTGVKNTVIKWGLVAAFCCLTAAAAVASGFNFEKVSVSPETSVQNAATEEQTINENEQSDLLSWQPVYNIADGAVNALKRYIPGYYTKELTATELSAVMPDGISKEMFYSGNAGFDGNGNLISVLLTVKSKTGQSVSVRISSDGTFRDYVFNSEAQVSKCGNTEYKVYLWDSGGGDVVLVADAEINGCSFEFTADANEQSLQASKNFFSQILAEFAKEESDKPNLAAISAGEIPEWFDNKISFSEALDDAKYGHYMLGSVPKGFEEEAFKRYKDQNFDYLSGLWTRGYDSIDWRVYSFGENEAKRLADVNDTKCYDLSLYPIPRASSVPDELREIVENPIFDAGELTIDVVKARAYKTDGDVDSTGFRMEFSVKYGEKIIEVRTKGVEPEWLYSQLKSFVDR